MRTEDCCPLHVVTDDAVLARADFSARAREVMAAGGTCLALHLRGPRTGGRRMFELASELVGAAGEAGSLLVVNDRLDVALAAGAHGVHLGARGLAPADARAVAGDAVMVGVSVHTPEEADAAALGDVDYVFAGNVYETASHPERAAAGLGLIAEAVEDALTVIAIGGVTPERVPELRRAGAGGVAVLSGVWGADDPARAVERYLEVLRG